MTVTTFTVPAVGVGRADYSVATEKSVEPVISSWQSVYLYREVVTVPAGGNVVMNVAIELDQVVLVYDFFTSIPANRLIRLLVEDIDAEGIAYTVIDEAAYQTVTKHLLKGYPFLNTIRFTTYNYGDVDEDFRIGCAGLYTSLEEYYIRVSPVLPVP
jgi:hypothetical protein